MKIREILKNVTPKVSFINTADKIILVYFPFIKEIFFYYIEIIECV